MQHKRKVGNLVPYKLSGKNETQKQHHYGTWVQQQLQSAQRIKETADKIDKQHHPNNQADGITETHNQYFVLNNRHQQRRPMRGQCRTQDRQLGSPWVVFTAPLLLAIPCKRAQPGINYKQADENCRHNELSLTYVIGHMRLFLKYWNF